MKAIVRERYGPPGVLELREIGEPEVGERDVLVRVRAAGVNKADWHFLTGTPRVIRLEGGLLRPKRRVLGLDAAGTVEAVGGKVKRVRPGDEVLATSDDAGAFAELVRVSEDGVVPKPAGLGDEEAAAVPVSALTALQGLRDHGKVRPGQRVLVNGASGGVGTFAVQIAKALGAEVTGVCSGGNAELVRSLGADDVVDYGREDFTGRDGRYDVVLDLVGNRPLADCRRALGPAGVLVAAAGSPLRLLRVAMTGGKRMSSFVSRPNREDLVSLKELLEAGRIRPVIERRFPWPEVPAAIRHVGTGRTRGKVVVGM